MSLIKYKNSNVSYFSKTAIIVNCVCVMKSKAARRYKALIYTQQWQHFGSQTSTATNSSSGSVHWFLSGVDYDC
ncbi:hypothetical protein [Psychrobacter sp. VH5]|uniref:hypothetical protein n=1 Tax=Psychrobacter sp. VH5 TaxID=3423439 RepID=UPI003D64DC6E